MRRGGAIAAGAQAAGAIAAALLAAAPGPALGHPMGNVSINHYAGIEIGPGEVGVKYLLDYAEIPSVRELDRVDPDRDEMVTPEERESYLAAKTDETLAALRVEVNGRPLDLRSVWSHVTFPPGEGGLSTVRIAWQLRAEIPDSLREARNLLVWSDDNHPDHEGWKEIRFAGVGGIGIGRTSLRRDLRSGELSEYPPEYLYDPPRDTKAWCQFGPGLVADGTEEAEGTGDEEAGGFAPPTGFGGGHRKDPFVALIRAESLGPRVVLVSLLLALVLGAGHALEPGHGKTIVAAYLVGTHGTVAQAVALGLVVTVTHTFSVFLLGAAVLLLSRYVVPETLLPWLGAVSGVLIAAVGLFMLRQRLRERRAAARGGAAHAHPRHDGEHHHEHHHPHDHDHDHGHGHGHGHDHGHSHVPPGKASLRSILALGISGGLVPCPAGLVVLLAAVSLGRVAFGLLLIVAFSVGLALVLTGIGVLFVVARRALDRVPLGGRLVNGLGIASAVVVTIFGVVLAVRSLVGTA